MWAEPISAYAYNGPGGQQDTLQGFTEYSLKEGGNTLPLQHPPRWQILTRAHWKTQLELMPSLQPKTLWSTVCMAVFNSLFHSSLYVLNMLF